jgi:predicted RNA-binding Zn-ribbon protein involved in translation (DUF1610 family)
MKCLVCGEEITESNYETSECPECGVVRCLSCDFGAGTVCLNCDEA